ncbi:uncharacterized protein LOC131050493 [Cryptomeria japonica]|uniref:uncharacterized protein LOC131050493 n=1 Tax=Cryptomeria japonica TaxID=3369 RepID=UPI0027DAA76A|nr:uncharacterized protein LOC131050493 [Cryptomeria japonica]
MARIGALRSMRQGRLIIGYGMGSRYAAIPRELNAINGMNRERTLTTKKLRVELGFYEDRLRKMEATTFAQRPYTARELLNTIQAFSFSSALATAFGNAEDMVATSLDSAGFYGRESDNIVIWRHRDLVSKFFESARVLLSKFGEIHVTHKEGSPYYKWDLVGEAGNCGLFLSESVDFKREDYPGHINKRGDGKHIDKSFPLGKCKTYKFRLTPDAFQEKVPIFFRDPVVMPLKRSCEIIEEDEEYIHAKRTRIEDHLR